MTNPPDPEAREGATGDFSSEVMDRVSEGVASILEHALDIIALVSEEGRFRFVNPAMQRALGYEPESMMGMNILAITHPEDRAEAEAALANVLARPGAEERTVTRVRTLDAGWRTLETVATSYRTAEGEIMAVFNARDITERLEAEERARRSEERLRSVIDRVPIVLWALDAEGTFVLSEGRGLEALGLDPGEVVGRSVFEVYAGHPEILEDTRKVLDGEPVVTTRRVEAATFDIYYEPLTDDGRPSGAIGVAIDASERQSLEDQLRQAQKMEAVGQLTGGIAHDFNNLLTIILTNLAMARDEVAEEAEELRDLLGEIERAADTAASVVRKLLAYSRSTAVSPQPVDLADELGDVVSMLDRFLPDSVAVAGDHAEPGSVVVRVDPVTLHQMALNLATNARDAMEGDGELLVSVEQRTLNAETGELAPWMTPGDYGVLAFRDTGPGMDAATAEHVFEPFFTTKPKGVGTGLGLPMVYGLTKQQEGLVLMHSEPGEGTTVELLFPVIERAATEEGMRRRPDESEEVRGGTETILFVEDEEAIRHSGVRILERFGYRVLTAPHGRAAIELLREAPETVDLVVTDMVMPEMGGGDLARWIEAELTVELPVLLTTGYTDAKSLEGFEVGSDRHLLRKPWDVETLVREVRAVLDGAATE